MNTVKESLPTTEEYYALIGKEESELTPVDSMKIKMYENYINVCRDLEEKGILPDSANPIITKDNWQVTDLEAKENRTAHEEQVLKDFQDAFNHQDKLETENTRKLAKAGYVDASIIIVVILNVGFIIAMAILGR